jgi:L-threonylcarbamoyladenylate synthase
VGADAAGISEARERLVAGELVGLPTETVYGLAADASNTDAVNKIFAAKGRPADHPLIVHVASAEAARAWASDWPASAETLAQAFWPGPMTLIVKRAAHVLDAVTGGQDTVGLRVPSHPAAQALLRSFIEHRPGAHVGIAAPSANQFGHVSPTTAQHVCEEFPSLSLLVLNGGACEVGIESTIVDVSGDTVRVLRPGRVRVSDIERVLGVVLPTDTPDSTDVPRVSGALASHYAPRTSTQMIDERRLRMQLRAFRAAHDRGPTRCIITHSFDVETTEKLHAVRLAADAHTWEYELYALLRKLDSQRYGELIIEAPPQGPEWDAVNDRVKRATANGEQ